MRHTLRTGNEISFAYYDMAPRTAEAEGFGQA
jgi:hypothetical protein